MRNFTERLRVLSVLCNVLLLAVCGLSALSVASCRTQRQEEQVTIRADTLSLFSTESETLEMMTVAIPGDTLSLRIRMQEIQLLPDGAAFVKKDGRTRLTVKRDGDAVLAEAETDSIGQTMRRYERKARDSLKRSAQNDVTEKHQVKHGCHDGWRWWVLGFLAAVTVGIILWLKHIK